MVRAVLFTDVVGSTALAAAVGDARADAMRSAHFSSMRKVIGTSGGYEVKTIGDAVMAGFDSAVAVVDCAVRMKQAVAYENDRSGAELAMRIGISMGEVADSEGDLHGMPVVEAARLCAAAEGGQILVADVVRQLVESRSAHPIEKRAALELKGLPAPLDTCEVLWSNADVEPDWLPRRLADVAGSTWMCRGPELDVLREAWNTVTTGRRRLALIAGEPGIGKTRLLAELAKSTRDATIAYGWCDQDSAVAFLPWVHIVSAVARSHPDVLQGALTSSMVAEISRLVPELSGALSSAHGGDAEMTRLLLFDAVDAFLTAASARQPMLVVLDDLHWADAGSLALLRHDPAHDEVSVGSELLELLGGQHRPNVDAKRARSLPTFEGELNDVDRCLPRSTGGMRQTQMSDLCGGRPCGTRPRADNRRDCGEPTGASRQAIAGRFAPHHHHRLQARAEAFAGWVRTGACSAQHTLVRELW